MIIFKIIGGILLLILLLLLAPAHLRAGYGPGGLTLRVRYAFLGLNLSPDKLSARAEKRRQKPKKERAPKAEKAREDKAEKAAEQKSDTLALALELARACWKAAARMGGHLVLRMDIRGAVATPDAHQTALRYAKMSAFLSVLVAVLGELFDLRDPHVSLTPDFSLERSVWLIEVDLRIQPIILLGGALGVVSAFIKRAARNKNTGKAPNNKKGGKVHESAASNR